MILANKNNNYWFSMDDVFISSQKYGVDCQDDQLDLFQDCHSLELIKTERLEQADYKNETSICQFQDNSFRAPEDHDKNAASQTLEPS
jgi:hypothetical protein